MKYMQSKRRGSTMGEWGSNLCVCNERAGQRSCFQQPASLEQRRHGGLGEDVVRKPVPLLKPWPQNDGQTFSCAPTVLLALDDAPCLYNVHPNPDTKHRYIGMKV